VPNTKSLSAAKIETALGNWYPFITLRNAYIAYCREEHPGRSPKATKTLGMELKAILGEPREPTADEVRRGLGVGRGKGYDIPDAKTIRELVYAANGIAEVANG
jgi:hypothetical protein